MTPYYSDEAVTIYHGDCLELLPTLSADAIIFDPPYGVGIDYGSSYDDELSQTTELIKRVVILTTAIARVVALTAGKWETELALYRSDPSPRWRMCWYKGAQSTASPIGFNDWEAVLIYGDKIHNNAHDYFHAQPEQMGAFGHPCPKPLAFAKTLITRLAKPLDVICDPFAGSGTTLRAAKDLGHRAIGIEIDERYCEAAAKRMSQGALDLFGADHGR